MTQRPMGKELSCTYPGCPEQKLVSAEAYARAAGWHIWSGPTVSGKLQEIALCPSHAGNTKIAKKERPEWDEPLW